MGNQEPDLASHGDGINPDDVGVLEELDSVLDPRLVGVFAGCQQRIGGQGRVAAKCVALHLHVQ